MPIKLSEIPWAYHFPRPNWVVIREWIEDHVPAEQQPQAWDDAALQWLESLDNALPDEYQVLFSEHFLFFLPQDHEHRAFFADFAESVREQLFSRLDGVAQPSWPARLPVLLFDSSEAYYEYKASYFQAGDYGGSGAMCVTEDDYVHLVINGLSTEQYQPSLAHELTHAVVKHLNLPRWLEEGLTQLIDDGYKSPWTQFSLDPKETRKLREYWNDCGLKEFWWGSAFYLPDEGQLHSYQLAAALKRILVRDHKPLLNEFLLAANEADAGDHACRTILKCTLPDLATQFLGEGDWQAEPPDATAYVRRAQYRWQNKERASARDDCEQALKLDPKLSMAYEWRGHILSNEGNYTAAKADLEHALRLDPRNASAQNTLAWLLATCPDDSFRDGKTAVELATKACERIGFDQDGYLDTLAAAYAEIGDFAEAITLQEDVIVRCREAWAEEAQQRLELYRNQQPYREPCL